MAKFELSKLPEGAQPVDYDINRPKNRPDIKEVHTRAESDAQDSNWFQIKNPFFDEKVEALFAARIPEQKTGIKVDLLLLQSAAGRMDRGLTEEPDKFNRPWIFLMDEFQYQNLMAYLEHLTKLGHQEAAAIKQKISEFIDLTRDESEVLLGYLLDRERYLNVGL
jgi:hypothetical protein